MQTTSPNLISNLWEVVEVSGVSRNFLHSRPLICSEFSLPLTLRRARMLLFVSAWGSAWKYFLGGPEEKGRVWGMKALTVAVLCWHKGRGGKINGVFLLQGCSTGGHAFFCNWNLSQGKRTFTERDFTGFDGSVNCPASVPKPET